MFFQIFRYMAGRSTWKEPRVYVGLLDMHMGVDEFGKALYLMRQLTLQQMVAYPDNASIGLVMLGSDVTINQFGGTGGYENIKIAQQLSAPNFELVQKFKTFNPGSGSVGDFCAALQVAIRLAGDIPAKAVNIEVFVFVGYRDPGASGWEQKLADAAGEAVNNSVKVTFLKSNWSPVLNAGINAFVSRTKEGNTKHSEIVSFESFYERVKTFRNKDVMLRPKSRVDLEISADCKIPVHIYVKCKKATIPTLSKFVADSDTKPAMERLYFAEDDLGGDVVTQGDQVQAYKYGASYVPVSEYDKMNIKTSTVRELKILATVDQSQVPFFRFIGCADVVFPEAGNSKAAVGLAAYIAALAETNSVALARFVYAANRDAKLVGLYPRQGKTQQYLTMVPLPFSEDARDASLVFKSLPSEANREQNQVLTELINSLSFDDKLLKFGVNPAIQRFWQSITEHAVEGIKEITPPDEDLLRKVYPEREFEQKLAPTMEELSLLFPLKLVAQNKEEKKLKFWRSVTAASGPVAPVDVKAINVDGYTVPNSDRIETVNPVRDFVRLLHKAESRDEKIERFAQLHKVVNRILQGADNEAWLQKALFCVIASREEAIGNDLADVFNAFLKDLIERFKTKRAFWSMIVDKSVKIIGKTSDGELVWNRILDLCAKKSDDVSTAAPLTQNAASDDLLDLID